MEEFPDYYERLEHMEENSARDWSSKPIEPHRVKTTRVAMAIGLAFWCSRSPGRDGGRDLFLSGVLIAFAVFGLLTE